MITVTEQAAAKIRDLFAEQGDPELCLRLSVDKGGCEGYSYGMALDRTPAEDDQVVEAHGVRLRPLVQDGRRRRGSGPLRRRWTRMLLMPAYSCEGVER